MRRAWGQGAALVVLVLGLAPGNVAAQDRKDHAAPPGREWLTSGGSLSNQRYSTLAEKWEHLSGIDQNINPQSAG